MKDKTSFKNANDPSTIDLFLTSNFNDDLNAVFTINAVQACFNVLDKHPLLKPKLLGANISAYISKPLKLFEKFIAKANLKKALKRIGNRETFVEDCTGNTGNVPSIILNRLLLRITSYSRKVLNHFFHTRQIMDHKLGSFNNNELLQDDALIAKELKSSKISVSTLNINENIFIANRASDCLTDPIEKAIEKLFKVATTFHSKHLI